MCFGIIFYTNSLKCVIGELWKNIYDTIVNKKIFDKWSKANTEKVENLVWYILHFNAWQQLKRKKCTSLKHRSSQKICFDRNRLFEDNMYNKYIYKSKNIDNATY